MWDVPVISLFAQQSIQGKYELDEVTKNSFVIQLTQAQAEAVKMQWWAVERDGEGVNLEVLEGESEEQTVPSQSSPTPVASPSVEPSEDTSSLPTPNPTVTPIATPSPTLTPSPSPTVEPTPLPSASPESSPEASVPPTPTP
jgi:hypothetical protein